MYCMLESIPFSATLPDQIAMKRRCGLGLGQLVRTEIQIFSFGPLVRPKAFLWTYLVPASPLQKKNPSTRELAAA
jgi:hypothetical protein